MERPKLPRRAGGKWSEENLSCSFFFQCVGHLPEGSIQVAFGLLTGVPNNSSAKNDGASYFVKEVLSPNFADYNWLVQLICSSWNKNANFDLFVPIV